jgi:hypothetical protein
MSENAFYKELLNSMANYYLDDIDKTRQIGFLQKLLERLIDNGFLSKNEDELSEAENAFYVAALVFFYIDLESEAMDGYMSSAEYSFDPSEFDLEINEFILGYLYAQKGIEYDESLSSDYMALITIHYLPKIIKSLAEQYDLVSIFDEFEESIKYPIEIEVSRNEKMIEYITPGNYHRQHLFDELFENFKI